MRKVASHSNVMFCRLVKSCDRKVDDGYFTFKPPAKYLMNLFLNIWSIRNIWLKHECITVLRLVFVVNTFVFFTPLTFQISDWILVIKTLIFYPAAELFKQLSRRWNLKLLIPYRFNELAQPDISDVCQWLELICLEFANSLTQQLSPGSSSCFSPRGHCHQIGNRWHCGDTHRCCTGGWSLPHTGAVYCSL